MGVDLDDGMDPGIFFKIRRQRVILIQFSGKNGLIRMKRIRCTQVAGIWEQWGADPIKMKIWRIKYVFFDIWIRLDWIKGDRWALAEVCTLLSALILSVSVTMTISYYYYHININHVINSRIKHTVQQHQFSYSSILWNHCTAATRPIASWNSTHSGFSLSWKHTHAVDVALWH